MFSKWMVLISALAVLFSLSTAAAANSTDHDSKEKLFWESVKDSGDPDSLRAYLTAYPYGANRIEALFALHDAKTSGSTSGATLPEFRKVSDPSSQPLIEIGECVYLGHLVLAEFLLVRVDGRVPYGIETDWQSLLRRIPECLEVEVFDVSGVERLKDIKYKDVDLIATLIMKHYLSRENDSARRLLQTLNTSPEEGDIKRHGIYMLAESVSLWAELYGADGVNPENLERVFSRSVNAKDAYPYYELAVEKYEKIWTGDERREQRISEFCEAAELMFNADLVANKFIYAHVFQGAIGWEFAVNCIEDPSQGPDKVAYFKFLSAGLEFGHPMAVLHRFFSQMDELGNNQPTNHHIHLISSIAKAPLHREKFVIYGIPRLLKNGNRRMAIFTAEDVFSAEDLNLLGASSVYDAMLYEGYKKGIIKIIEIANLTQESMNKYFDIAVKLKRNGYPQQSKHLLFVLAKKGHEKANQRIEKLLGRE